MSNGTKPGVWDRMKQWAGAIWGHFENEEEIKKYAFLSAIFFFIIGVYWALRPMKDSIFDEIVGLQRFQPRAKMLSVIVIFPLVLIYSKLIDMFRRDRLFYVFIGSYAFLALIFGYFFAHPTIGLENTVASGDRILGWLWYVYVESFGSMIVALFWVFVTDTTSPVSARRGFPIVALLGQAGNVVIPFILSAKRLGFRSQAPVVLLCGALMIITGIVFWVMMKAVDASQWKSYHGENEPKESEAGFLEGLKLLLTRRYLLAILFVVMAYEILITSVDFHFKASVAEFFAGNRIEKDAYLNSYAVWTGIVAFLSVLFGVSNIQRHLGIGVSLLLLPVLVATAVGLLWTYPNALALAFWIMVFSKAINYALNSPTMKQVYIPTTKETRYKAQGWIEMFGSRSAKALSSALNDTRKTIIATLGVVAGSGAFMARLGMLTLGTLPIWIFAVLYIAKTYDRAIKNNEVVC